MRYVLIISLLFLFSCQKSKDVPAEPKVKPLSEWANMINGNATAKQVYLKNAYIVNTDGSFIRDHEAIDAHYANLKTDLKSIAEENTLFRTQGNDEIDYKIQSVKAENDRQFKSLIVLQLNNGKYVRELEMMVETENIELDRAGIDEARKKWIELCNAHDATKLVHEMYTTNSFYYNHDEADIGPDVISKTYSYMNREAYSLDLKPIHIEAVRSNLAYEIGQCSGSYSGKYVIIWEKQDDGRWMVLLDTNI